MEKYLTGILLLYSIAQSTPVPENTTESFIIHYLEDKRIFPVRVELNTDQQTERIISVGGETLYDFKQGKVAYKDLNSSQCFISDIINESLERDRRKLRNIQKGVVRSSYLPTYTVQGEDLNGVQLLGTIGNRIAKFCRDNVILSVARSPRRGRRDISGKSGQFTHHSYGHYGHQSNNYAHYGQETHITGSVDKDGNVQNHKINQHQVRTESSQPYPSRVPTPYVPAAVSRYSVNPQFQAQPHIPTNKPRWSSLRPYNRGASGQFSLQTAQESGYQLNLPLGLKAGNFYQGGIRSEGQYNAGSPRNQMQTDYQKYGGMMLPSNYQTNENQIRSKSIPAAFHTPDTSLTGLSSTDYSKSSDKRTEETSGIPSYHDRTIETRLPTNEMRIESKRDVPHLGHQVQHSGIRPQMQTSDIDSRFSSTDGIRNGIKGKALRTPIIQGILPNAQFIPSTTSQQRAHDSFVQSPVHQIAIPHGQMVNNRESPLRIQTTAVHPFNEQRTVTGPQILPSNVHLPSKQATIFHPGSSILTPGHKRQDFQPSPSAYLPDGSIHGQTRFPQGVPTKVDTRPETMQLPVGISRSRYDVPNRHLDTRYQQHLSSGVQAPSGTNILPPGSAIVQAPSGTNILPPGSANGVTDSTQLQTEQRFNGVADDGVVYPSKYLQTPTWPGSEHSIQRFPDQIKNIPTTNGRITPIASSQTTDIHYLRKRPTVTSPNANSNYQTPTTVEQSKIAEGLSLHPPGDSYSAIPSGIAARDDRTVLTSQGGPDISKYYAQDSASSQTQIQTNVEGTAAEASAGGQYRGIGSQTQVQGGYMGNGSFSALAQSGFTGGVMQSQVQGGQQGGLSASSSQVEKVGAAQSQVQIGRPSGSASSSAQGRFSGGITQVQAQSSKIGGSARAQSQSTGLSNSHVQVNIGGVDTNDQDRYQGTVSASVQGGHYSGQSQTQLHGGYDSGRTYVATAQGGFDSATGFQSSLPNLRSHDLSAGQPIIGTVGQAPQIISKESPIVSETLSSLNRPDFQRYGGRIPGQTTGIPRDINPEMYSHPSSTLTVQRPPTSDRNEPTILSQHFAPSSEHRKTDTLSGTFYPPSLYQESRPRDISEQLQQGTSRSAYIPSFVQSSDSLSYPSYQTDMKGMPKHTVVGIQGFPSNGYNQNNSLFPGTLTSPQLINQHSATQSSLGQQRNNLGKIQPQTFLPGALKVGYQPGLPLQVNQPESGFLPIPQQHNYSAISPIRHSVPIQQPLAFVGTPSYLPHHMPSFQPSLKPTISRTDHLTVTDSHSPYYPPPISLEHPQISPPQPRIPSQRTDEMVNSVKHDIDHMSGSQLTTSQRSNIPTSVQISSPRTQLLHTPGITTSDKLPSSSVGTDEIRAGMPGVLEPENQNCCEALRNLKNRCCGNARKQNEDVKMQCCRPKDTDFNFDFNSDDSNDNGSCKVVKATCYIVYKPAGKARICKPTATTGC